MQPGGGANNNGRAMISMTEVKGKMRNLDHYRNIGLRNHQVLPSEKSTMMTTAYLDAVRAGDIWCPLDKIKDNTQRGRLVKMRNCPDPPPRIVLA